MRSAILDDVLQSLFGQELTEDEARERQERRESLLDLLREIAEPWPDAAALAHPVSGRPII